MFDSYDNMLPAFIPINNRIIHSNALGIYVKLSDRQDINFIVRHVLTVIKDKRSNVAISRFKREYIFQEMKEMNKRLLSFDNFYDYLRSCLFYKSLNFTVFPVDACPSIPSTIGEFIDSEGIFACSCRDYINVTFILKNQDELDSAYDVCKLYPFDELRLITKANVDMNELL